MIRMEKSNMRLRVTPTSIACCPCLWLLGSRCIAPTMTYWHVALTTMEDGSLATNLSRIGKKLALKTFAFGWSVAAKTS